MRSLLCYKSNLRERRRTQEREQADKTKFGREREQNIKILNFFEILEIFKKKDRRTRYKQQVEYVLESGPVTLAILSGAG